MKTTRLDCLHTWSVWQPDRRVDFNGFFWERENGNVLIDPMPLDEAGAAFVEERGGAGAILITNADHWRAASELRERFGAKVCAPAADDRHPAQPDIAYEHAGQLPLDLADDIDARAIRGGKSNVEFAFYLRPLRALLFGDVVRSHEIGRLRLLPDEKLADRAAVLADLAALRDLNLDVLLLGDGDSLLTGARSAWLEFLRQLATRTP